MQCTLYKRNGGGTRQCTLYKRNVVEELGNVNYTKEMW